VIFLISFQCGVFSCHAQKLSFSSEFGFFLVFSRPRKSNVVVQRVWCGVFESVLFSLGDVFPAGAMMSLAAKQMQRLHLRSKKNFMREKKAGSLGYGCHRGCSGFFPFSLPVVRFRSEVLVGFRSFVGWPCSGDLLRGGFAMGGFRIAASFCWVSKSSSGFLGENLQRERITTKRRWERRFATQRNQGVSRQTAKSILFGTGSHIFLVKRPLGWQFRAKFPVPVFQGISILRVAVNRRGRRDLS